MVESMVRGTLKRGMKLWIVTSDRVLATVANRGESPARPDAEPEVAVASHGITGRAPAPAPHHKEGALTWQEDTAQQDPPPSSLNITDQYICEDDAIEPQEFSRAVTSGRNLININGVRWGRINNHNDPDEFRRVRKALSFGGSFQEIVNPEDFIEKKINIRFTRENQPACSYKNIVQGDTLIIQYDPIRIGGDFPERSDWEIHLYADFYPSDASQDTKRPWSDPKTAQGERYLISKPIPVPEGSERVEIWLEAVHAPDDDDSDTLGTPERKWDSNNSQNYCFHVIPRPKLAESEPPSPPHP